MNIGFDAKRFFLNSTGLGNYSRDVVKDLARYYPNNTYHLFTTKKEHKPQTEFAFTQPNLRIHTPKYLIGNLAKSYWRSILMENDLLKNKIDVYHGLSNEIPKRKAYDSLKYVVTIHDLIFLHYPNYYKPIDRSIYNKKFRYAAQNSDTLVAISQQTKQDLVDVYHIKPEKIHVIYQSCHDVFKSIYPKEKVAAFKLEKHLPESYILYVGTIEKRKNLEVIIKALPEVDLPLVVLGKKTNYYHKTILPLIKDLDQSKKVIFLENVPLNNIPFLYQGATVFVYPSKYEGFGIPVLEALYSKTPVITSNSSSLKEVGKHSFLIDPEDKDQLVHTINNKLSTYDIEKAYTYAQTFSSEQQAKQLHDIYRKV